MPQFMACLGICTGYFTCYGSVRASSSMAWRAPYIVQAVVGMLLAMSCIILPQSPRWLITQGRRQQAIKALERLNFSQTEAEKDILRPTAQSAPSLSMLQGIRLCFRRGYRSRTILALFTLGMVQLCGIDGVLYVSHEQPKTPSVLIQVSMHLHSLPKLVSRTKRLLSWLLACQASSFLQFQSLHFSLQTAGEGGHQSSSVVLD